MNFDEHLQITKDKLDKVSPSFCLAKWLQVTLHLQNGFNHSCHHPNLHQTSKESLAKDPSALHNTPYKKELRAMMLKGERPSECDYCWRVEDAPGHHFSDRVIKSGDNWAISRLNEIASAAPEKSVNPSYMEVSFGNECNFRCSYCGPDISSSIWSSYEKHGEYVGRVKLKELREQGRAPIKTEENPYVDAFWKWFPDLLPDLKVFRITGGEPLVNPNTYRVLDYIEAHPQPSLQLCINSNLGIPERHFRRFVDKISALTKAGKLGDFRLFTSVDTHGSQAEYLRVGLNYDLWLTRVRTLLTELPWEITFMVTFNTLSVPRFNLLLKDIVDLNRDFPAYRDGATFKRTMLDISHILHPQYFSPWILNERWINELDRIVEFMDENGAEKIGHQGFYQYELHKMKRIATWARSAAAKAHDADFFRARFFLFTGQFAAREGKNFLDVFPEMEDFYTLCEQDVKRQGDDFVRNELAHLQHRKPEEAPQVPANP